MAPANSNYNEDRSETSPLRSACNRADSLPVLPSQTYQTSKDAEDLGCAPPRLKHHTSLQPLLPIHTRSSFNSEGANYPEVVPASVFAAPEVVQRSSIAQQPRGFLGLLRKYTARDAPIATHSEKSYLKKGEYITGLGIRKRSFWIVVAVIVVVGLAVGIAAGLVVRKKSGSKSSSTSVGSGGNTTKGIPIPFDSDADPDPQINIQSLASTSSSTSSHLFSQNTDGNIVEWKISGTGQLENNQPLLNATRDSPLATVTYNNLVTLYYINATTNLLASVTQNNSNTPPSWEFMPSSVPPSVKLSPNSAFVAAASSDNSTLRLIYQDTTNNTLNEYITSTTSPSWSSRAIITKHTAINSTALELVQSADTQELRLYYQRNDTSVVEMRLDSGNEISSTWVTGTIWPRIPANSPIAAIAWSGFSQTRLFSIHNETAFGFSYFTTGSMQEPGWKTIPGIGSVANASTAGINRMPNRSILSTVDLAADGNAQSIKLFYINAQEKNRSMWVNVWTSTSGTWDGGTKAVSGA